MQSEAAVPHRQAGRYALGACRLVLPRTLGGCVVHVTHQDEGEGKHRDFRYCCA